ncbi:MAG: methionine adenosyltransferase [Firmicutes bacterium]|nr:methionine adenosyltransferase [Bacillota bacterium]
MKRRLFTSESVAEGHPDKMADQICDAILDAIIEKDPPARVACECTVKTGLCLVTGEISTNCYVDMPRIVRDTIKGIGYTRAKFGFDGDTCSVLTAIEEQSPDIALGVDVSVEAKNGGEKDKNAAIGAGDQGMMFGFACDETPVLMPMPIYFAHRLARRLAEARKTGMLPYLRPDGKTQVTIEYVDDKPVRVDAVVVSAQHGPDVPLDQIREDIIREVIRHVIPAEYLDDRTRFFVNPTGRFVIGGPQGDSGLSGRKIIVDTYGGYARHGGGSFSGKDPTKVDRTGSYAARYVAKNIVEAGLARKCEVQVAYVIGVARPVSLMLETFGTSTVPEDSISETVTRLFDFRPGAIIERFGLRKPIFRQIAAYGHFGRDDLDLPWEKTDMAAELHNTLG